MPEPAASASEDFSVTADGRRLAVRRLRPPGAAAAGPTLVFLHEGLGSIAQWRDFPTALCALTGRPGLVYDRWGFGGSDPVTLPRPTDYLEREATGALPAVLEACGIQRPILIGHSDGGTIALLYAAAFPDRPAGCITEAAHVFVEAVTLAGIRQAVAAWDAGELRWRLERYHGDKTESAFRGWAETWLSPAFRNWNIVERLPGITCPLLVMQGADDEYGTPAQVAAIAEGAAGLVETCLLPDCAHIPHLQARDRVLAEMSAFVNAVRA
ncbi:MAG: alpha/beta hydrolase [Kiloniellales bacterium]|nr:alpha/beta hydrolase [Kiloniellales bacterium]MDJ0971335.1 alpha/beta hydrolase [Kiloniellales bacterium]